MFGILIRSFWRHPVVNFRTETLALSPGRTRRITHRQLATVTGASTECQQQTYIWPSKNQK